MHLERSDLERRLAGALPPDARAAADEHLASCAACRERLDDLRVFSLLEALDAPAPPVSPQDVIARASRASGARIVRWAAGLALTFGAAGALYAAPGSPVPGWLASLRGPDGDVEVAPPDPADVADPSGVVVPAGERLEIRLEPPVTGTVSFRLVDGAEVTVEALDGAATFDSRAARVDVTPGSATAFRISVPRDGADVEVLVGGRTVFRLRAGTVTTAATPDADAPGVWAMPLAGAR